MSIKFKIKGSSKINMEDSDIVEFSLENSGQHITLLARKNKGYKWAIATISVHDGQLHICECISEDLGIKTTDMGGIMIGKNY